MRTAVLILTSCLAAPVLAQDHAKVDPEHVKVVAETSEVRVLRYRYEPHQKSAQHSHPDNTIDVAITKGKVRLISPDGTSVEHSVEAGTVNLNPASTHIVENLGDTPFEGLSIEPKSARSPAAAAQTNHRLGTWKLDVGRSTFSPGPPPRHELQRAESAGDAIKVSNEITDASGNTIRLGYTAKYDGKPYPYPGSPWDTIALTRVDAYTSKATFRRDGKVVQTTVITVSRDGQTLTLVATGTNPAGQPLKNREVFDRQ
jgi:quercetin dioxygenase-like cupin family protein